MVDVVEAEGGVKRTSFRYTLCLSRGPQGSVAKVQYITGKILACVDKYISLALGDSYNMLQVKY